MAKIVLDMSMSLDGFISGPQDNADHPMGLDGHRLFDWLADDPPGGAATITFVTDGIEAAVTQAKAAAGDRNVLLHGAATAQHCLRAGLLDEMEIHLVPVLLGQGRRLFDHLSADHVELELTRVVDAPGITHLHYRVRQAHDAADRHLA
jgi:RibD domain-containing protein